MRIYRVAVFEEESGEHLGYGYFRTRREALASKEREDARYEVEKLEVPATMDGILEFLNRHASHPFPGGG